MLRSLTIITLLILSAAAMPNAESSPRDHADVTFTGRVFNAATLAPIPGALVTLDRTSRAVLTEANGEYRMIVPAADLPNGDIRLVVQMLGFERGEAKVPPGPAGVVRNDIVLTPAAVAFEGIVAVRDEARELSVVAQSAVAPTPMAYAGAYPPPAASHPNWNTENYSHISENAFRSAVDAPLSTFSIDVDRASYSNIRRFLLDGTAPPTDAVRIEEMVNYFTYEYPTSNGSHPFAVTTELGAAPWRDGHWLLRIGLASEPIEMESLPPNNLVFLLDVSGSMNSPDKLPLVKQSIRLLVDQLRPQDRVAIVVYAGAAGLVLPSTPGSDRQAILGAIEALEAGGSTAGGAGLLLAYRVARENHIEGGNNRVILATDGDFNVGVSSDSEMVRLVTERRAQGTFLTVLGFGTGNLKDSKMEQMAQHGNGNYAYIDSLLEARKTLVTEMGGTLLTVASDVKLQVEFNPAVVSAYRLIGYENRLLAPEDFNDDQRDAGELGAGHVVTALYEIVPVGADSDVRPGDVDPLRYQRPAPASGVQRGNEAAFVRVRYKRPGTERSLLLEQPVAARTNEPSTDFRFASAVAGFGMLLRESEHRGTIDVPRILALASAGRGRDEQGHRGEFIRLVERYRWIAGEQRGESDDR